MSESHDITELKQYIDDSSANLARIINGEFDFATGDSDEIKEQKDSSKLELLYEVYANFMDLKSECTDFLKELRMKFKIKEAAVKAWLAESKDET